MKSACSYGVSVRALLKHGAAGIHMCADCLQKRRELLHMNAAYQLRSLFEATGSGDFNSTCTSARNKFLWLGSTVAHSRPVENWPCFCAARVLAGVCGDRLALPGMISSCIQHDSSQKKQAQAAAGVKALDGQTQRLSASHVPIAPCLLVKPQGPISPLFEASQGAKHPLLKSAASLLEEGGEEASQTSRRLWRPRSRPSTSAKCRGAG